MECSVPRTLITDVGVRLSTMMGEVCEYIHIVANRDVDQQIRRDNIDVPIVAKGKIIDPG